MRLSVALLRNVEAEMKAKEKAEAPTVKTKEQTDTLPPISISLAVMLTYLISSILHDSGYKAVVNAKAQAKKKENQNRLQLCQ